MDTAVFVVVSVVLALILFVFLSGQSVPLEQAPTSGRELLDGFSVAKEGPLELVDLSNCVKGTEETCYYNNPSSPYTTVLFRQAVPSFTGVAGQLLRAAFALTSPTDLFVVEGVTPPACAYWGFTLYLLNKPSSCGTSILFASLTDTVNNVSTRLPPQAPLSIAFGCNRDSLAAYAATHPGTVTVPFPYQGPTSYLYLLGRTALYASEAAGKAYLEATQTVGRVLTYKGPARPDAAVLEPVLAPRAEAVDENVQARQYDLQAEVFLRTVQAEAGADYRTVQEVPVEPFLSSIGYDNGYDCIRTCTDCLHDNRDTTYIIAKAPAPLPRGALIVVFGVNHATTGKALYTSLTVYNGTTRSALTAFEYTDTSPPTYGVVIGDGGTGGVRPATAQLYTLPAGVTAVDLAERAYVQQPGSVSAALATLYPYKVWILSK